jgi:hypothetical protein
MNKSEPLSVAAFGDDYSQPFKVPNQHYLKTRTHEETLEEIHTIIRED